MPTKTERRLRGETETREVPRKCSNCKLVKEGVRSRPVPHESNPSAQVMKRTCAECADKLWLEAATI